MAKKEKVRRKSEDEIRIIECIKDHLNKYSAKSNLIRYIDFKEETDGDSLRFIASIDYGTFEQRIVYYPVMLLREQFIDVEFSIGETGYVYTFYDIFNLFDIGDFNLYFYNDLLSVNDVETALEEILNATEKYFADIERAGTGEYLPLLEKNYETDMNSIYGSDYWKEEEPFGFVLPLNHPYYPIAENSLKTLKKLRKRNAKDKLDTIYEKRLLEYLESGKAIREEKQAEKTEFEKLFKKAKIKMYILLFAVSAVLSFLLALAVHAVIFSGAVTFGSYLEIFGITVSLPISGIGFCLVSTVFLIILLVLILGRKLVAHFIPEKLRSRADAEFDRQYYGNSSEKVKKAIYIFGVLFFSVMFVLSVFLSSSDIGYYDTGVKFMDNSLRFCNIPYEEIEISKLQGYYNNEEFIPYENAYVIFSGDKSYELGELLPNGQTQQKLEEIAEKYNKEIKEIKTIEDLYENSGN